MDNELYAVIRGRVQGVGFRYSALRKAQALDLSGWVMNRPDGTVELTAQGARESLEALLEWLAQGPPGARVSAIEHIWRARRGTYGGFEVRG
jgi:acylphosphatase